MNKKLPLLVLAAIAALFVSSARAIEFKFRNAELPELIGAFRALDYYERVVDQGPGNPARVVRQPFAFARETRAKLGANLIVLQKAAKDLNDRLSDLRLKISGNPEAIDDKEAAQVRAWNTEANKILAESVALDLSPITTDELKLGSGDGENPIPITVLGVLNALRPPK